MVCWGRWRTINGNRVCIEDPLARPLIFVAVAAVITVIGSGTAVSAAAISTVTAETAVSQSLSVRVNNSRSAARRGQYDNAWLRMGLRYINRQTRTDPGCTAHSTGQVRKMFPDRPVPRAATVADHAG